MFALLASAFLTAACPTPVQELETRTGESIVLALEPDAPPAAVRLVAPSLWEAKRVLRDEGAPVSDRAGWVLTGDPE